MRLDSELDIILLVFGVLASKLALLVIFGFLLCWVRTQTFWMGTGVAEVVETLPSPTSFKVHRVMCTEFVKLVDRVAKIFPEIEAARPRCSSGIQALCSLNAAIEKAKLLLQHCSESSKLYLALTGDVILLRCQRLRNSLEQSLSQMQNMVPVMLAVEGASILNTVKWHAMIGDFLDPKWEIIISRITADLRAATFVLDASEEEVTKVLLELLKQDASASDSLERMQVKALQLAASRLDITTPKAILIEKRSIKRLLDKVCETDQSKKKILEYFLYLLKKREKLIIGEQTGNARAEDEGSFSVPNQSSEVESHYGKTEAQADILSSAAPPEEFKCPISLRVMYDPVIIESGQTFERMWIQKWFDDGNDTCPKTETKLVHRSLTPNTAMKDLISKWCKKYGITIPDPSILTEAFHSWDVSSTSIASFGSSMNDLRIPLDVSNVSLGSSDTSYCSDTSYNKISDGSSLISVRTNDLHRNQASANTIETDLSRLSELDWECQCRVVEDAESHLKHDNQACHSLSSRNFVEPLIRFLRDALDLHDIRAQRIGSQLLLIFVRKYRSFADAHVVMPFVVCSLFSAASCRRGIQYLPEDAFDLLASFLNSEVTEEVLAIIEVLSSHPNSRSKIVVSGALASILKILDSENREFQEHAIIVLLHLSSNNAIYSHIVPSECILKLVPLLKDTNLAGHCLIILKNLCNNVEARASVAETSGCLPSIAELLEIGSREDQEHAVAILLSLCSQRVQYCQLVMNEGVIPALVNISINGNEIGKVSALELLRLLRDVEYDDEQESPACNIDTSKDARSLAKEKKSSSKTSGIFVRKFSWFSKSQMSHNKKEEMKLGF
ncbi:hypothetical protein JRO89_XS08G0152000 [Xanthoceras sorbifolium]|uniref:RING-type E3 ubiquitin transferase n=1 Tax=Xanthoceras sorbifolium TaxID=99658 RepID=A0ABQ8HQ02_9ROSI|nr:hypothetical protein JRO89_XS08G0152000 [Xanthoceras sorbifolium]